MINYAFIFVRGGSKGLPKKNSKLLLGKPLLQYSIDIAKNTDSIQKVFVSTEDTDLAFIAKENGAEVIDRPAELAGDNSPEWLSWQHAVDWVQSKYGAFDNFISLPATSPLRSVEDVTNALTKRISKSADICISITEASRSPYFNMVVEDPAPWVKILMSEHSNVSRRQDAPEAFDITTVVYATTPEFVLNSKRVFDGKVTAIKVPKERAVDIDDIYDFKLAEAILSERKEN